MFNKTLLKWHEPQTKKEFFTKDIPFKYRFEKGMEQFAPYGIVAGLLCSIIINFFGVNFVEIRRILTWDSVFLVFVILFSSAIPIGITYLLTKTGLGQVGLICLRTKDITHRTDGVTKAWPYKRLRSYTFVTFRTDFETVELFLIRELTGNYYLMEMSGEVTRQQIHEALEGRLKFDSFREDRTIDVML